MRQILTVVRGALSHGNILHHQLDKTHNVAAANFADRFTKPVGFWVNLLWDQLPQLYLLVRADVGISLSLFLDNHKRIKKLHLLRQP